MIMIELANNGVTNDYYKPLTFSLALNPIPIYKSGVLFAVKKGG